jgi:hypothetical protein
MKNITRLALAFAVAAIACLSPMAHAEDEAQLVGSSIPSERYYDYYDKDGYGSMFVKDGPKYSWGRPIDVTISQNGKSFSGKGWRSLTSEENNWLAKCEFWVYGDGVKAKFQGSIQVKYVPGYEAGGYYYLNGYGTPYPWECALE